MIHKLKRYITVFNKSDEDTLVKEIPLPDNVDIEGLQKLFGLPLDNPMHDCYPIDEGVSDFFRRRFGVAFDFTTHEYFIECHEEDCTFVGRRKSFGSTRLSGKRAEDFE